MKLLTTGMAALGLVERIEARLRARGLSTELVQTSSSQLPEAAVDPLSFNLLALEGHADPTLGLPLETHRGGVGRAVIAAKWLFRKTCQIFINEALARQKLFNGHVRDSYAQLSAEMIRVRADLAAIQKAGSHKDAKASRRRSVKRS